jgi:hypothetical protein
LSEEEEAEVMLRRVKYAVRYDLTNTVEGELLVENGAIGVSGEFGVALDAERSSVLVVWRPIYLSIEDVKDGSK